MEITVKRWGNGLGIRIPGLIAKGLSLKAGSSVNINDNGGEITIKPVQKYCLVEMLNQVTEENMHEEIKTGVPVGKEVW